MAQIRQHRNAKLTVRQRREMVSVILEEGWPVAAAAERFQVSAKTARKWRDRYLDEGADGMGMPALLCYLVVRGGCWSARGQGTAGDRFSRVVPVSDSQSAIAPRATAEEGIEGLDEARRSAANAGVAHIERLGADLPDKADERGEGIERGEDEDPRPKAPG